MQTSVASVPITFALQALEEYSIRMKAFIESYQNGVFNYQINSWSNLVSYLNIFMKWHSYNSWHQVRFLIYKKKHTHTQTTNDLLDESSNQGVYKLNHDVINYCLKKN